MQDDVARCIGFLDTLVAFDTTSHKSNLELIGWAAATLSALGAETAVLPSPDKRKANLFATFGRGPNGGIVLSAHTDVVPAEPKDWQSNPFRLAGRGNRLHGRGTCDMKGFIACVLAFASKLDTKSLSTPVHIALSYDEELGCLGIPGIVSEFGRSLPSPTLVIVGEPTSMRPVVAHKGYRTFETVFTGSPAHSSRPTDGVSAIRIAAAFITALDRLSAELAAGINVEDMDPAFSTVNAGSIEGGLATNVIPPYCRIAWELRPVPGTDVQSVMNRLNEIILDAMPEDLRSLDLRSRIVTRQTAAEPVFSDPSGLAYRLVRELTGIVRGETAPYGSEAGFFQEGGLPTVIFGPGDVRQAHKIDEYIEADQLAAYLGFLDQLDERLRRKGLDGL